MKVVHVVYSLETGGLENGVVNLVNRTDPARFNHVIFCLTRSGRLATRIRNHSVEIIEAGLPASGFRFPAWTLARLIRQLRPDVVHTRGWVTTDAVFAAKLAGVARVIHGEHGRDWKDTQGTAWKRNQIRRVVGHLVNRYVVVCEYFRGWLQQTCRIRESKIAHIPNGVDTEKFHPWGAGNGQELEGCSRQQAAGSNSRREQLFGLRRKFGLPVDGLVLGSVGRLDPVKDFNTLLCGFAAASRRFPKTHLAIAGGGPLADSLKKAAGALGIDGSIHWLGERDDIPSLMRCFDVFVQTSLFEGMSNTILEAMASGLPVIATDTGGNGELVVAGENGILIPVGDANALALAIESYLMDSRTRHDHSLKSRERALRQFDLSLMAQRYAGLYEEVAAR
ncbi:MAG: glycosyltransferase [Candidatus Binatia bacterium]